MKPCPPGKSSCSVPIRRSKNLARKAVDKIRAKGAKDQPVDNPSNSETTAAADYQTIDAASLQAGELRSLGPEYICHATWQEPHLDELLMAHGVSTHVLPLMKALVIGRLTSPGSELRGSSSYHQICLLSALGDSRESSSVISSFARNTSDIPRWLASDVAARMMEGSS